MKGQKFSVNGGREESSTEQMSFGQGGKRNFCVNFSSDRYGNDKQQNFEVGYVVLLKRDSEQNEWPMEIIEEVMSDYNGFFRSVKLRIRKPK